MGAALYPHPSVYGLSILLRCHLCQSDRPPPPPLPCRTQDVIPEDKQPELIKNITDLLPPSSPLSHSGRDP